MRQKWIPTGQDDPVYVSPYSAWNAPITKFMPNSVIGATTELLFCEIFSSFLICLMFMTLKFRSIKREGSITKERDSVLIALALCGTSYAVTEMISQVSGTFVNPAISFEEMLTSFLFVSDQPLAARYCFARIAGPFIGAIIAGIFFLF
jgi:glycerol uptake facilitator-like aquaporin